MNYSLPYILFIGFLLLIALLQSAVNFTERSRRTLSILALIVFVLFIGGRGFIGWDWTNYYRDFARAVPLSGFLHHKWMFREQGWNLYVSIIRTFTDSYNVFVFVSTLIDAVLLYLFFARYVGHKYFVFALAVFFVFYGFVFETDLMRNIKGLLIFLLSIRYIESRELVKYLALGLLACTFHWSIIVLLPCYFFIHRRFPLVIVIAVFLVGNVVYLFGLPSLSLVIKAIAQFLPEQMQERVLEYVTNALFGKTYGFTLGYIERTLVFVLVLFLQHRMIEDDKSNLIFINTFTIFVLICMYCYEFNIFITRFGALFSFGCWVMYPRLLKYLDKVMAPLFAILVSAIMLVKMHNMSSNILYDYQNFIFQKTDSYSHREQIFRKNQDSLKK
ncbi:MAG: EpsG family protein [Paludibacteraceae bacterium]|nr:EpsG family protein [Paludibacteraceae bacterium]